jgi:hypothetical protein
MGENDAIVKLRSLSPNEFEILKLYCQNYRYYDISKEMHIARSTVKNYMGRIYVKLGLDQLPTRARTFALARVYCPAIKEFEQQREKDKALVLVGKEEEPLPIKGGLQKIVEEDDGGPAKINDGEIIPFESTVIDIDIDDTGHFPERRKINPLMIGFVVIALLSILFTGYSLFNRFFGTPPASEPQISAVATQEKQAQPTAEPVAAQVIPIDTQSVPTETSAPVPTPLPKPAILFEDDFEQGLSDSWEVISGNPVVVNGMLSSDRDTWILVGDPNWTNYSVEFDADTYSNWYSWGYNVFGIRVQDIDKMYAYKWTTEQTEWYVVENGDWDAMPQSDQRVGTGMKNFRMVANGDSITMYIDGVNVYSFYSDKYPQGRVGFLIGAETIIDNFKIKEILE